MTERPLRAFEGASNQCPPTGISVRAPESLSMPGIHHQAESLAIGDPGPVGFDFVLPDDGPEVLWVLSRDFTWRRVWMKDDG